MSVGKVPGTEFLAYCSLDIVLSRFSHVQLFVTPWTIAHQAPLSMGFSRQEYWSGLPFPPPGGLPNPGIEPRSPALQADSLPESIMRYYIMRYYLYLIIFICICSHYIFFQNIF